MFKRRISCTGRAIECIDIQDSSKVIAWVVERTGAIFLVAKPLILDSVTDEESLNTKGSISFELRLGVYGGMYFCKHENIYYFLYSMDNKIGLISTDMKQYTPIEDRDFAIGVNPVIGKNGDTFIISFCSPVEKYVSVITTKDWKVFSSPKDAQRIRHLWSSTFIIGTTVTLKDFYDANNFIFKTEGGDLRSYLY